MSRVSPLVLDFLNKHPSDCARILEQLPVDTSCSLFLSIQPDTAAGILEFMIVPYGSECLNNLDIKTVSSIIKVIKTPQAARLLRAIDIKKSANILETLPVHTKNNINSILRYHEHSVGRIMETNPFCLPVSVSVSDAVKRMKILRLHSMHEIFVVDEDHKLRGAVRIADLLTASRMSPLQTVMIKDVPFLYARSNIKTAAHSEGWKTFSTLPVVEKDHSLSGILQSSSLMHILAEERNNRGSVDVIDEMFSLTKMYWIVMAELFRVAADNNKERSP